MNNYFLTMFMQYNYEYLLSGILKTILKQRKLNYVYQMFSNITREDIHLNCINYNVERRDIFNGNWTIVYMLRPDKCQYFSHCKRIDFVL